MEHHNLPSLEPSSPHYQMVEQMMNSDSNLRVLDRFGENVTILLLFRDIVISGTFLIHKILNGTFRSFPLCSG
jgi:hypothetical protein